MTKLDHLEVFVLIDALGWTNIDGGDFLSDLLPYRQPLRTVLGFSSGAIPAILTGLPPALNGHWNLYYYDPKGSPFRWLRYFGFLPNWALDHRVTRKIMKELGRRVLGMGSGFECCVSPRFLPFFNWVEKRNIYEQNGITGAPSIFDQLAAAGVPYRAYSYHHWTDEQILQNGMRDVKSGQVDFLFLYLSEMDMFLHMNCPDQARIQQRLREYEVRLRELFQAALEHDPSAGFTIISDHGMTPVRQGYDLVGVVDSAGFKMPDDYLVVYDSTMARFWFFNEEARRGISGALRNTPCGRLLSDAELQELGVFFPDRRYGELVFLLNPGWLLERSDFNGPSWKPVGMHGYHPDDRDSDAIFLSNRRPSEALRSVMDVHECMREAASIGPRATAQLNSNE